MNRLPESIKNLITQFNRLPGIGHKTSQKFVFWLLKQPKQVLKEFADNLLHLHDSIKKCEVCSNISHQTPCTICSDSKRDQTKVCIVAENHDLIALENTGEYDGIYHVLGGTINAIEGITPDQLNIKQLINRINKNKPLEIVLAFNPDLEGESTVLYLTKLLKPYKINLTRLAKGLPMGSVLEYADEVTLSNALKGRTQL